MAASDALLNEVARVINIEFFDNGQPVTGAFLAIIIKSIAEALTDETAND